MIFVQLISIFFAGVLSGFVGAVAGGGGLFSISLLLLYGIPPQITLATNKFGGIGLSIGGLYKFIKEKKIVWKYAIGLSVAGIFSSVIGSKILLSADPASLKTLTGVLLLLLVPTIFLKKDFGLENKTTSRNYKIVGYILYFLISIIASFFGGFGAILISIVVFFFGLPMIEANATELVSFTIFSVASVIIFMANGIIDYQIGIPLFIGMLIGGYLGAHIAVKKGNRWVKAFFSTVVIISAIKVLIG
ncbi:MAG: sulfite exporter TauE/SafE family protein [Candidatus Paceibacterota bacterium]|jgi:hypothetical protein